MDNIKKIHELISSNPTLQSISSLDEIFVLNKNLQNDLSKVQYTMADILDAENRLKRFAPYIASAFSETASSNGIIESDLVKIDKFKERFNIKQTTFLKLDSHLPISGSVKARGGIYEVLKFAEEIALKNNMLSIDDDYSKIDTDEFRKFFSNYSIAVGSTGNLGLSIGIISAKLGFKVTVHMSADAREWKKSLLRSKGVKVIEYPSDYEIAVLNGRKSAQKDPNCHFIDDENSIDLFMGYAVAGLRLKNQLNELNIKIDEANPINLYIPCGVGGAPGGITFGLKSIFGNKIRVFFAEPTLSPCMSIGLASGMYSEISVKDIGILGNTVADGLACPRPSPLVSPIMDNLLDGYFTVSDDKLFPILKILYDTESIFIEPSACAGFYGIQNVEKHFSDGIHIVWATGGNMVPSSEKEKYLSGILE